MVLLLEAVFVLLYLNFLRNFESVEIRLVQFNTNEVVGLALQDATKNVLLSIFLALRSEFLSLLKRRFFLCMISVSNDNVTGFLEIHPLVKGLNSLPVRLLV